MPRPSVLIDKDAFISVINALESKQKFSNISALCNAVCETDWAKTLKNSAGNPVVLQPMTVRQRIEEFKVELVTQPGKRGNPGVAGIKREHKPRSEKFAASDLVTQGLKAIRDATPHGHKKLVNKIAAGSLKAAVRLKCLDCVNYESSLIGDRSCLGCPLSVFVFVKLKKFKKGDGELEQE